jgi:hypothetical protein
MSLEDFIITILCWVEEHLNALLGINVCVSGALPRS